MCLKLSRLSMVRVQLPIESLSMSKFFQLGWLQSWKVTFFVQNAHMMAPKMSSDLNLKTWNKRKRLFQVLQCFMTMIWLSFPPKIEHFRVVLQTGENFRIWKFPFWKSMEVMLNYLMDFHGTRWNSLPEKHWPKIFKAYALKYFVDCQNLIPP